MSELPDSVDAAIARYKRRAELSNDKLTAFVKVMGALLIAVVALAAAWFFSWWLAFALLVLFAFLAVIRRLDRIIELLEKRER